MKRKTLLPTVALLVTAAIGFMAGRLSSSQSRDAASKAEEGARNPSVSAEASRQKGGLAATSAAQRQQRAERGSSPENLARLTAILRNENPASRNRALFAFIDRLGPADFEAAINHFRGLGLTHSRTGEYALLLSAWAKADPHAALAFAKGNADDHFASDTVLATWASSDPDAALRWANASYEGKGPNPYLTGVIRGIAETDPEWAAKLLVEMPPGNERYEALDGVVPQLLARGGDVARAWIEGLTDESLRDAAMKRLAKDLAETDPAATAAWLQANPGEASLGRLDDVYSKWAKLDQQAAVDSISNLPAGDSRSNALSGVIDTLAKDDPAAAMSMLERFSGDVTEPVLGKFLWYSADSAPELAVSQISRIEDPARRDWWYGRTLGSWLDRDAAAANAWIKANPLPQPVLDQLANRPKATP
jgi:hypothetical protein